MVSKFHWVPRGLRLLVISFSQHKTSILRYNFRLVRVATEEVTLQYPREKMGSHFGTLCKFSKVTKPIFKKPIFRQTSLCKFSKLQNPFSSPKLQTPVFKGYKTFSKVGQSPIFGKTHFSNFELV